MIDVIRRQPHRVIWVAVFFVNLLAAAQAIAAGSVPPDATSSKVAQPTAVRAEPAFATPVVEVSALPDLADTIARLADRRVIFVGERHDRYEDHLVQLAILEGLQTRGKDLAIGMEAFQQPYQGHLDDYVAGRISEEEMLRRTQYFTRWRFDYRLYRRILRFAREHGVPVVALNLESELTDKVGDVGIEGLSAAERARLPQSMDRGDSAYRARLQTAFKAHPMLAERKDFEHFMEVQLLWDEGMAERAADYLEANPNKTLVVIAGAGHLEYGQGIPRRLLRRVPTTSAILLDGRDRTLNAEVADFLLFPAPVDLPKTGLLGVLIDDASSGPGVLVQDFADVSGAKDAGIRKADRIMRIDDVSVRAYSDVRLALIDRAAKSHVEVEVLRDHPLGDSERLTFDVVLH
ncbi:uncharacterized iron-regulated protein [Thioflavicoccus mobilis 8321]|uniref:Uncharacterized iron-regulated protein n=1 Tax=Thioflavicoccus mobilis 8321 TaxID=765912 RepID=L0GWR2_9GAMM|nr:ChaN family lipoprotein [Thioflavicoccus mobilis]AGA90267.1 uncharacterized iron-regulated protein [Thioflavicoccus mobilis 8321]